MDLWKRVRRWWGKGRPPAPVLHAEAHGDLESHGAEFEREVLEVVPGVHVAVGFGLANAILLEGDDGVIIVDTLGSVDAATEAWEAFRQITDKPVAAIIYTHNHSDHIFGAGVFAQGGDPPIYAHSSTSAYIDKIVSIIRPSLTRRSMRQFGVFLRDEDKSNAGIGPFLETRPDSKLALLRPTVTFDHRLEVEIAGIRLEMEHAPGETDDHIFIWLPEPKVMICGDNFYRSFPNLYAIRGTARRDLMQWVGSVDRLRDHRPAHLVPCHTRPLVGEEAIEDALRDYRDAIQYVHDQTVRLMNRGLTPDQIASKLRLPEHLAASPYLQEFYGTVAWSVRAVFHGYLGWFSGNPTDLSPLPPGERARRFASLAGGVEGLRQKTREAHQAGEHQWVLELTDQLLELEPEDEDAQSWRLAALKSLAAGQTSANGRQYYLTCAMELQGFQIPTLGQRPLDLIHSIPMATMFAAMAVNLNARASADVDMCLGFRFTDTQEEFSLHIRRGVAEHRERFPADPDIEIRTRATVWKELLANVRNPVKAFAGGEIKIEGSTLELAQLLRMFQPPDQ